MRILLIPAIDALYAVIPVVVPVAPAVAVTWSPRLLPSAIITTPALRGSPHVSGMNTAIAVALMLIPVLLTEPTVMVLGNTTTLLSTAVPTPALTVDRVPTPTLITPPPQVTANTALLSILLVPTALPALLMSVQPRRKATVSPTGAGQTMMELSIADPRPVLPVGTVPMSMQITL